MGPKAQRKGLGKHLMQICELVARKSGMQWFVVEEWGVGGPLVPTCSLAHTPRSFPFCLLTPSPKKLFIFSCCSVQLTVLKNNVQALDFYTRKMKYVVDSEISASAEDAAHEILTKVVNPAECQAIKDRG